MINIDASIPEIFIIPKIDGKRAMIYAFERMARCATKKPQRTRFMY